MRRQVVTGRRRGTQHARVGTLSYMPVAGAAGAQRELQSGFRAAPARHGLHQRRAADIAQAYEQNRRIVFFNHVVIWRLETATGHWASVRVSSEHMAAKQIIVKAS